MKSIILVFCIFIGFSAQYVSAQWVFGARTCLLNCNDRGRAFGSILSTCSCHESCEAEGRCCNDYWTYCSKSCYTRCGDGYHPLQQCQCYDNCTADHCCEDYKQICVQNIIPTFTTKATTMKPTEAPSTVSTTPRPKEKGYSYLTDRMIECEKGVPFTPCPINPCERSCAKHPDSLCLITECGSCEAKHFDLYGNEVNCYDPEYHCPNGQPIFDCGDLDLCSGTTCPGFPRAVCVPNKCGGCYYDFVDGKGNPVNCEIELPQRKCKNGLEEMECDPLPCSGKVCAADITATCRNVVCGECKAEFYDMFERIVDCNATASSICPDTCYRNPCRGAVCQAHPKAKCSPRKTLRCGACEPSFYLDGKRLKDIDCVIPDQCIDKTPCDRDPCLMHTCPGKDMICIANYCDGCNPLFFDKEGERIHQEDCYDISSLNLRKCPDGKAPQVCPIDLCVGQKCGDRYSAVCRPDECNNCELMFFDEEDNLLDCKEEKITCKDGREPLNCDFTVCESVECPGHDFAECIPDQCDECKVRFYGENMEELECVEEVTTTAETKPTPSPCPNGQPRKECSSQLCKTTSCESDPEAICKMNPCNDCELLFFDSRGRRISCDPKLAGTCEGECGNVHNKTRPCHCDYGCKERGDCCADFKQMCETCEGRCGVYKSFATCQCTADCRKNGDCCHDFGDKCLTRSCKGICNSQWNLLELCQCHPRCVRNRNCCMDYAKECA
ncbi:uncharacterized protein LOC120344179 [Styela clava]